MLILISSSSIADEADEANLHNLFTTFRVEVGAAPIVEQLKPLKSVVIDAGFVIDAPPKPEAKWLRKFYLSMMNLILIKLNSFLRSFLFGLSGQLKILYEVSERS